MFVANSPLLAGFIIPFDDSSSAMMNQLPGVSLPWILSEAPSEMSGPVSLTDGGGGGAFFEAGESPVADDGFALEAVAVSGQSPWGAMHPGPRATTKARPPSKTRWKAC